MGTMAGARPRLLTFTPNGDIRFPDAGCGLKCAFCPEGLIKRDVRPRRFKHRVRDALRAFWRELTDYRERRLQRVKSELSEIVREIRSDTIGLVASDILELEGLFDVLDICRGAGKKISIISPGLRLADREFAERLKEYSPRVTITYLSDDAEVYERLTGVPESRDAVRAALRNLAELGMSFAVNCVVTRHNCEGLSDTAGFLLGELGLDACTLVCFIPEGRHLELDPGIAGLFAPYPMLDRELLKLVRGRRGKGKRLSLVHVPPCKVDEEVLRSDRVAFCPPPPTDPDVRLYRDAACESCDFKERCCFVFQLYRDAHPGEPFPFEKVNRHASRLRG